MEYLILSDLHLEGKSEAKQQMMLQVINYGISQKKAQGKEITVLLAGDIHNGTQGVAWIKEINAPVIYVCGNHEFWNNDYNEVIDALQTQCNENITFLHNNLKVINNDIILGATLWTDVGKSLNPDILPHASWRMNDNVYIKNKQWYAQPGNMEKARKLSPHHNKFIEEYGWNVLCEQEENAKSVQFFNDAAIVGNILNIVAESLDRLKSKTTSTYAPISKEMYEKYKSQLLSYKKSNISLKDYHEKINPLINSLHLSKEIPATISSSEQIEHIFNQVRKVDPAKFKFIVVSHHLPFLEEVLIGRFDNLALENNDKKILLNEMDERIFMINSGTDYPYHDYFWRISKGDVKRAEDITRIMHYHNNGVKVFTKQLLEHTSIWVHGHEHSFNYQDVLKNIMIVSNPGGSFDAFEPDSHARGFKIKEQYIRDINNVPSSYQRMAETMRFVKHFDNTDDKKMRIQAWVLKNTAWEDYQELLQQGLYYNKKLLKFLLKEQIYNSEEIDKNNAYDLKMLSDAINFNVQQLNKFEAHLNLAYNMRVYKEFSFNKKIHHNNYARGISEVMHGVNQSKPEPLTFDDHGWCRQTAFFNIEYMKRINKNIEKIKSVLGKIPSGEIINMPVEYLREFNQQRDQFFKRRKTYENDGVNKKYAAFQEKIKNKYPSPNNDDYF